MSFLKKWRPFGERTCPRETLKSQRWAMPQLGGVFGRSFESNRTKHTHVLLNVDGFFWNLTLLKWPFYIHSICLFPAYPWIIHTEIQDLPTYISYMLRLLKKTIQLKETKMTELGGMQSPNNRPSTNNYFSRRSFPCWHHQKEQFKTYQTLLFKNWHSWIWKNLVVNRKFEKKTQKKQNGSLAPPTSNKNSGLVTPILHLFAGCPNDPSVSGLSTLRRDPRSWLVGRLATLDHQCIRHRFKMF